MVQIMNTKVNKLYKKFQSELNDSDIELTSNSGDLLEKQITATEKELNVSFGKLRDSILLLIDLPIFSGFLLPAHTDKNLIIFSTKTYKKILNLPEEYVVFDYDDETGDGIFYDTHTSMFVLVNTYEHERTTKNIENFLEDYVQEQIEIF